MDLATVLAEHTRDDRSGHHETWTSRRAEVPITKPNPGSRCFYGRNSASGEAGGPQALGSGNARGGRRTCTVPVTAHREAVPSLPYLVLEPLQKRLGKWI